MIRKILVTVDSEESDLTLCSMITAGFHNYHHMKDGAMVPAKGEVVSAEIVTVDVHKLFAG